MVEAVDVYYVYRLRLFLYTMSMSLPSFAQAFSSSSLSEIVSNALPPIQPRPKRARVDVYVHTRIHDALSLPTALTNPSA